MERLHMNDIREVLERSQRGESDRAIARDLGLSRVTVRKYRQALAGTDEGGAAQQLKQWSTQEARPVQTVSSVEPYRAVVVTLLERGVEMRTIHDRLRADHGYGGSYSSVRRFVRTLQPKTLEVTVRVHTGPGEEAQVDFGSAGKFLDPTGGVLRTAYVFVMTLSYSRHQYAELVFDQKIPTWLAVGVQNVMRPPTRTRDAGRRAPGGSRPWPWRPASVEALGLRASRERACGRLLGSHGLHD
jgi:transposase